MACLIAAPCSGSGKTLLSLCLAAAVQRRGESLQPFKVGPDYLDPQLLAAVAGRPCRNLDPILCGETWLRDSFHWHGSRAERVLVEGVMGLFDGRGPGSEGSSAAVAALLDLPVVLVVEASRQAGSLAALVRGFRDHGPPSVRLAGVVLNRVGSERHRQLLAEALQAIAMPLLGILPHHPALELPSRHLGLLPAAELADLRERQHIWADLAERHLDLPALLPLLAPPPQGHDPILQLFPQPPAEPMAAVAVAQDAALHFRYPETSELLEAVGLATVPWSPLSDAALPADTAAVLLPGGYPELHAERLAGCGRSLGSLAAAAARGVPLVAECGGLLLLGQSLADAEGLLHPMAGLLPFVARRGELSLGYRQARSQVDGLLVRRGESCKGHEFHRWQLDPLPSAPAAAPGAAAVVPLWQLSGWGCPDRLEGWSGPRLHASWLHLHWAGAPAMVRRLAAVVHGTALSAAVPPECGAL